MRIAWFSPLNDPESISSYSSALLIPEFKKSDEIVLFSQQQGEFQGQAVKNFLSACNEHEREPFDLFFYQFEDRRCSYFVRAHLALVPGVVLFHNFTLSDFGPEPLLNSAWRKTLSIFEGESSHWPKYSDENKQTGPQGVREASLATVKLFSSERDLHEWKRLSAEETLLRGPAYYLPLPVKFPEQRSVANIDRREKIVAFCGSPRIEDRAHKIFEAVRTFPEIKVLWLISEGEKSEAEALLEEFEVANVELQVGRTPERWAEMLQRAQCALHTRFSVFGQLGPYLPITLAAGVPAVVTRFAEGESLPDGVLFKVGMGSQEILEIRETLSTILNLKGETVSALTREYALETHASSSVATALRQVFLREAPLIRNRMQNWEEFSRRARLQLRSEAASLLTPDATSALRSSFDELGWGA